MRLLRGLLSDLSYQVLRFGAPAGARPGAVAGRAGVRVLMYHRVTDAHPEERLCVSPSQFEAQLRLFRARGYTGVTFAQVVQWVRGRATLPERALAITFDDGYQDNFRYAYPALQAQGFTGCFFIPTGFIERGAAGAPPEDHPMTWEELRELLHHGHEIGAHSVTHRKLTMLPRDEAVQEVRASKGALERALRCPVSFFCYPAGAYSAPIREAVAAGGFQGACTVEPGANRIGGDPFTLRRTEISRFDSLWDVEKKLAGAYDWLHGAVQGVRRLRKPTQCANAMTP